MNHYPLIQVRLPGKDAWEPRANPEACALLGYNVLGQLPVGTLIKHESGVVLRVTEPVPDDKGGLWMTYERVKETNDERTLPGT